MIDDNLPEDKYIGPIDPNSLKETIHVTAVKEEAGGEGQSDQKPHMNATEPRQDGVQSSPAQSQGQNQVAKVDKNSTEWTPADRALLPHIDSILSLHDFEHLANQVMSRKAWAYYSSGADDEITMRENTLAFQRIWFRPRVLRNVKQVDYSTTILGTKTSMPIYIVSRVGFSRVSLCDADEVFDGRLGRLWGSLGIRKVKCC